MTVEEVQELVQRAIDETVRDLSLDEYAEFCEWLCGEAECRYQGVRQDLENLE
jgi:hypothetical protein